MPRVAALYRYPVKGFTPEACQTLTVLDEGRIAGDRVLGIRFADTAAADDAWSKKTAMVALMSIREEQRHHHSLVPRDARPRRRSSFRLRTMASSYWMTYLSH